MAKLFDLARMTTATTGTGTITLGSAVASFLTFAQAGVSNGDTVTYAIEDGTNREIGRGVYTSSGTTLTRGTILRSTNSNAAISLSGSAQVFIAASAEDTCPQTDAEKLTVRTTLYAAPLDAIGCNNLIINGAMNVSQQFGSTLQTADTNLNYVIDQWEERISNSNSGAYRTGQLAITIGTPPFTNCFQLEATTGAAAGAGDYVTMQQKIEGLVAAKLAWGTAAALPITIAFWVRCTISGTMTVILSNTSAGTRTYATNVAVNAANTWEYKTITIAGDTGTSWATDTTVGLVIRFSFACGSTFAITADTWGTTANARGTSSTTNFLASTNNTCRITGVSAFVGNDAPTATYSNAAQPRFDDDLRRCQRYWFSWNREAITNAMVGAGMLSSTTHINVPVQYPVQMPAVPSLTISAASHFQVQVGANTGAPSAISTNNGNNTNANLDCTHSVTGAAAGNAGWLISNSTSARLHWNARM